MFVDLMAQKARVKLIVADSPQGKEEDSTVDSRKDLRWDKI